MDNHRKALLEIGAQHPAWSSTPSPLVELFNRVTADARNAAGAVGDNDDAKADWCSGYLTAAAGESLDRDIARDTPAYVAGYRAGRSEAGSESESEAELFIQFHAIYFGRVTYNDDAEWIANLDACMEELCEAFGMSYAPQENLRSCIVTNLVESAEAVLTLLEGEGRETGSGGPLSQLRDDIAAAKGDE